MSDNYVDERGQIHRRNYPSQPYNPQNPTPPSPPSRSWWSKNQGCLAVFAVIGLAIIVISSISNRPPTTQQSYPTAISNPATQANSPETANDPNAQVIEINKRSVFSDTFYAIVDNIEVGSNYVKVNFESHGGSTLRSPESSCIVEKPSDEKIRVSNFDTPVRRSTNYKGSLTFNLVVSSDSTYYFRYSCATDYSDVELFTGQGQSRESFEGKTIQVNSQSTYSGEYYANIEKVEIGKNYLDVYFESRGNSDLRSPQNSCMVEKPSGKTISAIGHDTTIQESTHYKGYLRFPKDIDGGSSYYFRYSCQTDYSDALLFDGNSALP